MDVIWMVFDLLIPEFQRLLQDFALFVDLFLRGRIGTDALADLEILRLGDEMGRRCKLFRFFLPGGG